MIPRETNLSEAPAQYHLVKPKNPPKDIGYWISPAQDRLSPGFYFDSLLLCGKNEVKQGEGRFLC